MKEIKSTFSIDEFEKYGAQSYFHTLEQQLEISKVGLRVNSQLDWLAQLLGWNGPNYWENLARSVEEKRRVQVGSFGFYNGYIYPEVVEVRSWENKIFVNGDYSFSKGQEFKIGDETLLVESAEKSGDSLEIKFSELPKKALENLASGLQLRTVETQRIPSPFLRPDVGTSGDFQFLVREGDDGDIKLFPLGDTEEKTPFLVSTLFIGSRYWFDKPVQLELGDLLLQPLYDFERSLWWIEVPQETVEGDIPLEGRVLFEGKNLGVRVKKWEDPSDWLTSGALDYFKGVWGDKGGKLPLHFTFDALSLHGLNEELSVRLEPFTRTLHFDQLLEYVYNQRVAISPSPPNFRSDQVWWNSESGTFSFYLNGSLNCGPWAEIQYPEVPQVGPFRDYVFPDAESFLDYPNQIPKGNLVEILDMSGLNEESGIKGLTGELAGPGRILIFRDEDRGFWTLYEIVLQDLGDFQDNCQEIPPRVRVKVNDCAGLVPESPGGSYKIANLNFEVTERQPLLLMKDDGEGFWFISPPSSLKYIGNTRLFRRGDEENPLHGEMSWDFSNPDPNLRDARIFYYNRWEETVEGWELAGDWISVKENSEVNPNFDPLTIDFGTLRVYCNGVQIEEGVPKSEYDYKVSYYVDAGTGEFVFTYVPITYSGSVNLPKIEISDSITGVFRYDISESVFSGLPYRLTPNVEDSETLLRVWKQNSLQVSDSSGGLSDLRYLNPLRADVNQGPADSVWSRYHIRLSPMYVRDGVDWQRVALVCQNFGYWGTPLNREDMGCPPPRQEPEIYEDLFLNGSFPKDSSLVYSEPYLYSNIDYSFYGGEDYDNSDILPGFDDIFDDFQEADLEEYSPLNERRVILSPLPGQGYGEWEGNYYNLSECKELTGFLANDIVSESVQPVIPPVWDSSIYKLPPHCRVGKESGKVDSNNYVLGYAFFTADISAAGEPAFNFSGVPLTA